MYCTLLARLLEVLMVLISQLWHAFLHYNCFMLAKVQTLQFLICWNLNASSFLQVEGSIVHIMKALASHPSAAQSLIEDDSLQLLFKMVANGSVVDFSQKKEGLVSFHNIQLHRHAMQVICGSPVLQIEQCVLKLKKLGTALYMTTEIWGNVLMFKVSFVISFRDSFRFWGFFLSMTMGARQATYTNTIWYASGFCRKPHCGISILVCVFKLWLW